MNAMYLVFFKLYFIPITNLTLEIKKQTHRYGPCHWETFKPVKTNTDRVWWLSKEKNNTRYAGCILWIIKMFPSYPLSRCASKTQGSCQKAFKIMTFSVVIHIKHKYYIYIYIIYFYIYIIYIHTYIYMCVCV